jgi:hypothetical protein
MDLRHQKRECPPAIDAGWTALSNLFPKRADEQISRRMKKEPPSDPPGGS